MLLVLEGGLLHSCDTVGSIGSSKKKVDAVDRTRDMVFFFIFMHPSSLSKPGNPITHNATRPVQTEIQVCYASSSLKEEWASHRLLSNVASDFIFHFQASATADADSSDIT